MNQFVQFLKNLFIILIVLCIFWLTLNINSISLWFDIPSYDVLGICTILVVYLSYKYIYSIEKANKIEYEFTSIVNHTFRTPLTRINWLTKELEKELPQKDKMQYLQNTSNATNKLLEIVDLFVGIKNISNTSTYFFEATSIRDMIEKIIAKYREDINKKNITFQVPTFKDIPLLTVDIKKISFVFDALIENAILYTPKAGVVTVDCKSNRSGLTLSVKDNGMGMTFMERVRLFGRFYRSRRAVLANPDGMGLKLYLSKQIVKRHKGKLYASSGGENKGSTFFVKLPFIK